jgi:predicted GTPase
MEGRTTMADTRNVLIMGAAGRDFHNFNTVFRNNSLYRVVAFTATQIPDIAGREYPAGLTGAFYPDGIPIYPEDDLERLIAEKGVDVAVFAYSDVPHEQVMHLASRVMAAGADFLLLGPDATQIRSQKPVIGICAVRTGCGKSQTGRRVVDILQSHGHKVVVVRHPMPYGDLALQTIQRFASLEDLEEHHCTIEEREEYEPHIVCGAVVYAGVDYEQIIREAEKEADVIVWEGGNNDFSFYKTDVLITIVDPHRPGHGLTYHPGEVCLRMADIVLINKIDSADWAGIIETREEIRQANPNAIVVEAASPLFVDDPSVVAGNRVLVIEDGPTVTHGSMPYGAGAILATKLGAAELVDPRPYAVGSIAETFAKFDHLERILPAMGYGEQQMEDLRQTIEATPCDLVIAATPTDVIRLLNLESPAIRVRYELQEIGAPTLEDAILQVKQDLH